MMPAVFQERVAFKRSAGSVLLGCCLLLLLGLAGCEALPLASAAGTLLGVAGSAVSDGTAVFSLGKLDFVAGAPYDQCVTAVHDAINDLQLHLNLARSAYDRPDALLLKIKDDRNGDIEIRVERRSAMLCRVRVDLGLFGSEPTAKLIMLRIREHLPKKEFTAVEDK